MLYEIFRFEIYYRLKRPETYLFFLFLFIFSLFGVEFIFQGVELGLMKKNSPLVIAKSMGAITGMSMLIASLIMGVPVMRDFQYNMESLIYVNPILKRDYFWGRFLGSLVILLFIFGGVLAGMVLGECLPWLEPNEYLPFKFINYFQPFIWVALPIIFFGAAAFFITGALSKNMMVVYTQGIVIFVLFMLTKSITNLPLQAVMDPFSLTTLTQISEHWDVTERNTMLIPMGGLMLCNKMFWTILALVILGFGYFKLQMNVVSEKQLRKNKKQVSTTKVSFANWNKVETKPIFGIKALFPQLFLNAWFHTKSILKQPSFWAIVLCGFTIIIINSVNLGTSHGVDSYPATYLIIEELQEMSIYFFLLILIFYSAEIMWKEREAQLHLIYDSTPSDSFINLTSKFICLMVIYTILILSLIIMGILFQTSHGFFHYELGVYFSGFFLEVFPFLALYTLAVIFFQALLGSKYLGILATTVFFIANLAISIFGIEHVLLNFGGNTLSSYSEMNGYGHSIIPFIWVKVYWFNFGILLLIIASIVMIKGSETQWVNRWRTGKKQVGKPLKFFGITTILFFLGSGFYIFYNTNLLNEFWTRNSTQKFRADYEKSLKPLEYIFQPKIVDINLKVDLYPSQRGYQAQGYYKLTNPSTEAISEIHVQKIIETHVHLDTVHFDRKVIADHAHNKFHYAIYKLEHPLSPGDTMKMNFIQTCRPLGFEAKESNTAVINNGTFFDNSEFPSFGYKRKYELEDDNQRKDFGLAPRQIFSKQDDESALINARTGSDSYGTSLEIIISTEAPQTAITSGDLVLNWSQNGRNYFHYKSKLPIINFYSIVSAKYEVLKNTWSYSEESALVDLEIYYQKGHEYNLDRMMKSIEMSLDYYSTNFSPYQYKQIRIMEFPRTRKFAQSFPNTIPFSEALGFIMDIDDSKDVDMVFFITAHEVAHQWWGMQLEAANVQGQKMILETLAQYSAIMVLKESYSAEKVGQFLHQQYDQYLEGRRRNERTELPLSQVSNEEHIYYAKGAINMYAFQKAIGADKVNLALRNFLMDWRTFNNPSKPGRYATTQDLLDYFRAVTPDSMEYVITDLFERVNKIDTGSF